MCLHNKYTLVDKYMYIVFFREEWFYCGLDIVLIEMYQ